MKTLKLALVATLVACMMVGFANTDGFKSKPKKTMNTTITKALQNPELVVAMYNQLEPSFLNDNEQLYVVTVNHNWTIYRILGSRLSWIKFFRMQEKSKSYKIKARLGKLN